MGEPPRFELVGTASDVPASRGELPTAGGMDVGDGVGDGVVVAWLSATAWGLKSRSASGRRRA